MSHPRRSRRKLWIGLAILAGSGVALMLALPALLGTPLAKARIVDRINRGLAPGFLEVGSLRLGWAGPIHLERVALLDPKGLTVVATPSASIDRGLWSLLAGGMSGATLTLDKATLTIERADDGSINLGRALSTLIAHPDPRRDLTIAITEGTLRYVDPILATPATADHVAMTLRLPAAPNPMTGTIRLARDGATLDVAGSFDRWNVKGGPKELAELALDVRGHRWPVAARVGKVDASVICDGTVDLARRRGFWNLSGDARLLDVVARGGSMRGDSLALARVEAGWELIQGPDGWAVRRLSVVGPFGELKAEGALSQGGRRRIEGRLDLAAIAARIPHALRLRDGLKVERGTARLEVESTPGPAGTTWDAQARVTDLAARDGDRALSLRDPATLSARLVETGNEFAFETFAIKTAFLDASARGNPADGIVLDGTLDLGGLASQVGEWVDLGRFDLAGRSTLSGRWVGGGTSYDGSIRAEVRDLRWEGFTKAPIRRDALTIEASVAGASRTDGLPAWPGRIALSLGSVGASARAEVVLDERGATLHASASTPLSQGDGNVMADGQLAGRWDARSQQFDIEPSWLSLSRAGSNPMRIAATGRYDYSAGTLVLDPSPGPGEAPAVGLAEEGVRVSGLGRGLADLHASASLAGDRAALARALGLDDDSSEGRWSALLRADGDRDGVQLAAKVGLDGEARPTTAALRARYDPESDRLDVAEMTFASPYGTVDASGRLDDVGGRRRVEIDGTLAPDFAAITAWLGANVEPKAKVTGRPRPFRARGSLERGWLADLDAEVGFLLDSADVYGMRLGPTPVALRARGGRLLIDPIATSLNQGHVRLEPTIDLDAPSGPMLRLGKDSSIRDARINDEVSRRVLAYVAPILEDATTATGRIGVDLDHAEIPLGPGRGRSVVLEGGVVFTDVEFAPGPLADQLIRAAGRQDARLRLDRPVSLTIADDRVNQRGLAVPIGGYTQLELEGWVGFDRRMALTATLPVTAAMLGDNPLLADIVAGTRVSLPIGGTLDRPELDRDALADHLKDLGKSLLTRGATRGAIELLKRIGRPRDPDQAPLTPQERREKRLEEKAQRRGDNPP